MAANMHLVMFDIDGTLVDSNGFDGMLFAQAVKEASGIDIDTTWESYRHVTDSGILEEIFERHGLGDAADELGTQIKDRFVAAIGSHLQGSGSVTEILGAAHLLRTLRELPSVTVALATGGWKETAEMKLEAVGIDFGGIPFATASDHVSRTGIMRLAEQRAAGHGPFARKTHFGDSRWDKKATEELGYEFVAVGSAVKHPVAFADLSDATAILEALGG